MILVFKCPVDGLQFKIVFRFHVSFLVKNSGKHKIVAIKKLLIFFFAFPVLSGKFGKQSLRFRTTKTFFFGINYWLFCTRIKTPGSYESGETILCFPEKCKRACESFSRNEFPHLF